jgi:hypothetical protein
LRAKRSNPCPDKLEKLDCFVAEPVIGRAFATRWPLAMTSGASSRFNFRTTAFADIDSRSHGAKRPKFCTNVVPRETREQGIPGARCTRGLVCKSAQKKRTRAYRFSGGNPAFPAQWFTAYFVLSPATGLSCHRRRRNCFRRLDASVGASGPHDFAVRVSAVRYRRIRVHRIPPRVRDDREPPLCGTRRQII